MAASMWDASLRGQFIDRANRLTPDARPGWGTFHVAGMMAHLNDSYRMFLGELHVAPKNLPIRFTPLKQLIIYVLPFPKSAPTAPELLIRCDSASLADEQRTLQQMFDKLAAVRPDAPLQAHPAFGRLTYGAYGTLMARHTDHHLTQFGV